MHPRAVEKDAQFRADSETARGALTPNAAILANQEAAFLAACEARPPEGVSGAPRAPRPSAYPKSYEVAAMRETHAQAYAPWTEAEESDLKRRHHQGETVAAIAARLGRKPGAIRSRLKKLALIGQRYPLARPFLLPANLLGTKPLRPLSNPAPAPTLQSA